MTSEDAIQMIKAHKFPNPTEAWQMLNNEAIDLAIEALHQKGAYDQTKWERDVALQTLEEHGIGLGQKAEYIIPSGDVMFTSEWRTDKPTEQGEYIVTLDSFGYKHIDLFYYGKPIMPNRKVRGNCWYRSDDEWGDVVYDDTDILAWQPLPTPYKGGDDE